MHQITVDFAMHLLESNKITILDGILIQSYITQSIRCILAHVSVFICTSTNNELTLLRFKNVYKNNKMQNRKFDFWHIVYTHKKIIFKTYCNNIKKHR